jgi:hypothetical protein
VSATRIKINWDTDGHVGGHAPYCESPYHSTIYYCTADEDGSAASRAFLRDHPRMIDRLPYMQIETVPTDEGNADESYGVVVPVRYLIERQECVTFTDAYEEETYDSWHVWDIVCDDYAQTADGQDGSHFSAKSEAVEWLRHHMLVRQDLT